LTATSSRDIVGSSKLGSKEFVQVFSRDAQEW
jgi:hypothetical protein